MSETAILDSKSFLNQLVGQFSLGKEWGVDVGDVNRIGIRLPSGAEFTFSRHYVDWESLFLETSATDRLWAYSLQYLPVIALEGHVELALQIAEEFYRVLGRDYAKFSRRIGLSWDHAVALRLTAVTLVGSLALEIERERLKELMAPDIEWALQVKNLKLNNHGLMLATSVLVASAFISEWDESKSARMSQYGCDCIVFVIKSVFGEDGYCSENSPFYAHFYIVKLKDLRKKYTNFLVSANIMDFVDETLALATKTLGNVLYQNGHIPPMGDSSPQKTWYESHLGNHLSQRTGLWVHKSELLYASLKSGHDSIVHKHVDDSSITLRYRGTDFVVDSGFCSYDYRDLRVPMLKSQRAHSGLFFRELDMELPAKVYRSPLRMNAAIFADGVRGARAQYTVDGLHSASRSVVVAATNIVEMTDVFQSQLGWAAIQRYVIPEKGTLTVTKNGFDVKIGARSMSVSFDVEHEVTVAIGQEDAPHKGWISPAARELSRAHNLEVMPHVPQGTPIRTRIVFS